jgi:hypothetical protein
MRKEMIGDREVVITNGKLYAKCDKCGKIVRLNKFLFGSLHPCA